MPVGVGGPRERGAASAAPTSTEHSVALARVPREPAIGAPSASGPTGSCAVPDRELLDDRHPGLGHKTIPAEYSDFWNHLHRHVGIPIALGNALVLNQIIEIRQEVSYVLVRADIRNRMSGVELIDHGISFISKAPEGRANPAGRRQLIILQVRVRNRASGGADLSERIGLYGMLPTESQNSHTVEAPYSCDGSAPRVVWLDRLRHESATERSTDGEAVGAHAVTESGVLPGDFIEHCAGEAVLRPHSGVGPRLLQEPNEKLARETRIEHQSDSHPVCAAPTSPCTKVLYQILGFDLAIGDHESTRGVFSVPGKRQSKRDV